MLGELDRALVVRLTGFVSFLRENGFTVGIDDSELFVDAVSRVGVLDRCLLLWTSRAALCKRAGDRGRFNELFEAWFQPPNRRKWVESRGAGGSRGLDKSPFLSSADRADDEAMPVASDDAKDGDATQGNATQRGATLAELLTHVDFKHLHRPDEMRALDELMRQLARRLRKLAQRRERSGGSLHIDFAGTARRSVSHGGEPIELAFRQHRREPPRLVLLLDVSRSMNLYSFFFLRLARALQGVHLSTQAFIWHTRLSRVTEALRDSDPWRAQERLQMLSAGWAGGTRIGECLAQFEREHARIIHGHTALMIVSDGYDTGEPELLANVMRRLRRRVRRVIWLNPLVGRQGYLPLARGMQAAMPYVDLLAPAHDFASLARVLPRIVTALR